MSKEIIINAEMAEEVRIAIVENSRLVDLDIETQSRTKHKGNIYKGIVSNIEDSLDAAFVEFGEEKQAFLPMTEIRPELYPAELRGQRRAKISDVLTRGQEIVVQVTKDEIGTKGAAVSTYLSLPGRFVVLMHSDEGGGGISRKIDNENARQAARDMLSRLSVPEGLAVIIRTAGMTASRQDLYRDFRQLCEIWQQINKGAQLGRAPTLLYKEPDIVIRTIRDYFSQEVAKIVIDDEEEYEDAHRYFSDHMPDLVKVLERHKKKEPIFLHYGIESAISELYEREVKLPSGGYVIIEPTEALVSIDVNSGKSTKEEGHAATVYKTNLEATEEIARQLRLRDLGGIIVIDFIDMISSKHRRDVEKKMRDSMHNDKARVKVGRISENGTLEMTRHLLRQSNHIISHLSCEN
jgi:ribonuclease E